MKSAGLFFGLAVVLVLTWGCAPPDREAQLRETIQLMAKAMEQHHPEPFLEHVADDFAGNEGRWNTQRMKRFLLGQALRKEPTSIDLENIKVTLYESRASAEIVAELSGDARWWPEQGEAYRFDTGWRLENGEWMIIRADWTRLDG